VALSVDLSVLSPLVERFLGAVRTVVLLA